MFQAQTKFKLLNLCGVESKINQNIHLFTEWKMQNECLEKCVALNDDDIEK